MYNKERATKYAKVWPDVLKDLKAGMKVTEAAIKYDVNYEAMSKRWRAYKMENASETKRGPYVTKKMKMEKAASVAVDLKTPKIALMLVSPENLRDVLERLM